MNAQSALVLGAGVMVAGIVLAAVVWWWQRRGDRQRRELDRAFRDIAAERLTNVVVPDGEGGEIHLDHVLLTRRGLVVVHVKRVRGTVFGSDRMDDWTVIDGDRRHTFANPQSSLYDRVAAVKRIVREVPVEGAIVFGGNASFSGGVPRHVATLAEFRERYMPEGRAATAQSVEDFFPHWQRLCDAVIDANLERLKRI